jgi:hypothetical protein
LKIKEENEELKEKTRLMKFQIEELKELRNSAKVWETIEIKWTKKLFIYKQQKEVLSNQVDALTQKKKDKENVLIDMEMINLKNVSMLNFEEIKRRIIEVDIEKMVEKNKEH